MKASSKILILLLGGAFALPLGGCTRGEKLDQPVRIAYFLGGRTANMYRAAMADDYSVEGVKVDLLAKNLYDKHGSAHHENYRKIDQNYNIKTAYLFAKATGDELIDYMLSGKADGATIGETAFIRAIREGKPLVAVAELGFDSKTNPGHALVLKHGILEKKIKSGEKFVVMSRRSSGGDSVFLREFFLRRGLDPDRVLDMRSNVPEDKFDQAMGKGIYDGAYLHLISLLHSERVQKTYDIYPLTWVDPQMSQALLVFTKDYVEKNPEKVKRLVRAIMNRTAYDNSHQPPKTDQKIPLDARDRLLTVDFHGMELPNFRNVPTVRRELLDQMQDILVENHLLDRKVPLEPAIDNRFVLEVSQSEKKELR